MQAWKPDVVPSDIAVLPLGQPVGTGHPSPIPGVGASRDPLPGLRHALPRSTLTSRSRGGQRIARRTAVPWPAPARNTTHVIDPSWRFTKPGRGRCPPMLQRSTSARAVRTLRPMRPVATGHAPQRSTYRSRYRSTIAPHCTDRRTQGRNGVLPISPRKASPSSANLALLSAEPAMFASVSLAVWMYGKYAPPASPASKKYAAG